MRTFLLILAILAFASPIFAQEPAGGAVAVTNWPAVAGVLAMAIASGLCGLAQGRARSGHALLLRVLPRFKPQAAARPRVGCHGHIACGQDVWVRRAALGIDQHATFASQARLARQLVVGHQAHAQHDGVARQRAAIGQQDFQAAI